MPAALLNIIWLYFIRRCRNISAAAFWQAQYIVQCLFIDRATVRLHNLPDRPRINNPVTGSNFSQLASFDDFSVSIFFIGRGRPWFRSMTSHTTLLYFLRIIFLFQCLDNIFAVAILFLTGRQAFAWQAMLMYVRLWSYGKLPVPINTLWFSKKLLY